MTFNKIRTSIDWKNLIFEAGVHKPVYYTLSGSHLYGFNSPDSDIDIRGCHCEELYSVLGLSKPSEVRMLVKGEMDFNSFDLKKELCLVLDNNSNVLEHLAATPLYSSNRFKELKEIAEKALSKRVAKPYWGMAESNLVKYLRTFNSSFREHPAKKYLYVIRGYMAGIYALQSGRIQPNLKTLNKMRMFKLSVVDELIEAKLHGNEKMMVTGCDEADRAIVQLQKMFKIAEESSTLPNEPNEKVVKEANDFLIKCRME
jgi:hypothetical protein